VKAPLNNKPKIGIDLMGSENAPNLLLKEVFNLAEKTDDVDFVIIGTEEIESFFSELKEKTHRKSPINAVFVKNLISMEENPLVAIRRKKDSSVCVGMKLLKQKEIDAFVSAGNTGAIIASAKMFLNMLPSISRPGLLAVLPTKKNPIAILDVGANISHKAENLMQFAFMGAGFQKTRGIKKPKIGLLNIGSEEKKGTLEIRKAYQDLQKMALLKDNFIFSGNIEGKEVFEGLVDVLVTDGFTGNVFLKTAEGTANFILDYITTNLTEKNINIKSVLTDLENRLHHSEYPGAILCGVEGLVIKCHSYSSPNDFANGVKGAIALVKNNFMELLQSYLS
jgi:phosphate acyltransferase